jgi:molybdopterin-guanine dinucleotide biosynthesis protein A
MRDDSGNVRHLWTAAILTGGQGRRLGGRDKSALRIGGSTILDRQLALVRSLTTHMVIISASGNASADGDTGISQDVRVVTDRIAGAGALGGLYTALVEAPTDQVLVIACDMPFVSAPLLSALARAGADVDVALPRDAAGRHPLCASYQRRVAPHLRDAIAGGSLRVLDALHGLQVTELGPDELATLGGDGRLLLNVNTPGDYDAALALATRDGADGRRDG